jgi:hypothetical protein
VAARDEYRSRVSLVNQVAIDNANLYQYQAAETFFIYGQFDEAKKRLEQVVTDQCKKTKWAFEAQVRLHAILRMEGDKVGDPERAKSFVQEIKNPKTSCAMNSAQKQIAQALLAPPEKPCDHVVEAEMFHGAFAYNSLNFCFLAPFFIFLILYRSDCNTSMRPLRSGLSLLHLYSHSPSHPLTSISRTP